MCTSVNRTYPAADRAEQHTDASRMPRPTVHRQRSSARRLLPRPLVGTTEPLPSRPHTHAFRVPVSTASLLRSGRCARRADQRLRPTAIAGQRSREFFLAARGFLDRPGVDRENPETTGEAFGETFGGAAGRQAEARGTPLSRNAGWLVALVPDPQETERCLGTRSDDCSRS